MKKTVILLLALTLVGCTTYKFQKTGSGTNAGYLAIYNASPIPEYTVGKDKAMPQDLDLAKERFKRRKNTVEHYYKKMDLIESRFKETFLDPPLMLLDFLKGIFRWPFIAVSDYRYHHNPKYKEKIDTLDQQKEELDKARITELKGELSNYIIEDLKKESPVEAAPVKEEAAPVETKSAIIEQALEAQSSASVSQAPVAIISANPARGLSPLTVKFSGQKSYSKNGKIVSYNWDFGDGDISTKKNPENTYWSTSYGSRKFTVTLTVKDAAGATSSVSSEIEVLTQ